MSATVESRDEAVNRASVVGQLVAKVASVCWYAR